MADASLLRSRRHVPALDGVRGVAIIAVIIFHFVFDVAPGGAFGVDIFFVLSAFLITGLLLREYEAAGAVDMVSFYVRRAARLLPALLVFLIVVAPLCAALLGTLPGVPLSSLAVVLYVSDFGAAEFFPLTRPYQHTWSLAVEEQFYFVWPALLLWVLRRRIRLIPFGIWAFILGSAIAVLTPPLFGATQAYFLPTSHLHSLAAGVLAAFLLARGVPRRVRALGSAPLAWAGVVAIASMCVLHRETWPPLLQVLVPIPALLLVAALVLHAASAERSVLNRGLSARWLGWFGTRSYGLYLFHVALMFVFRPSHLPIPKPWNIVCAIAVSMIIAELSFRFVERPVLRRGREWSRRRKESRAA